ncbi:MAG TPA: Gfo/Idh/MocA family oxidoreductase [Chitinophagaceae bacterium]|nr:Gfo/Idh/MocA family oxidoreductase [Chitinophagaceae bacterium]
MTQINTGICSYGMSGKLFHAPFIQSHPGFALTAIVERHKEESREKYPAAILYRSFEELLADKQIRLIVVNTPVQTHFDYVKACLEAGKAVVVEKPFTVTAAEAAILEEMAHSKKVFLSVYQNRRYDGDYRAVKNVLDRQLLGELKEAEIRFDRYRPSFGGKSHKEGELPGAGILHDLGAHMIDQALQLFGWPQQVFADIRVLRGGEARANDYFELLLYYPGLRVRIKSTVMARESYYAYVLHGSKGSFLQHRSDMQEEKLLAGMIPTLESWCPPPALPDGILHTEIDGQVVRKETTSTPGNYMGYYDDVYKALTGGAPNPVPAADAVKTMKIIEAAMMSAEEGRVLSCES